jgi:acetyl esterase/lipase
MVTLMAVTLVTVAGLMSACSGGSSGVMAEPTPTPRTGPAETRTGVAYASVAPQQTLDLYLPAGDGRTVFPLVVLIHGGGFFEGSATDDASLAELLVSKGFAAASLNYRLSGDALFPAGVQDVAAAVRYLRANSRGWGVDPHRIAAWGDSAGAYLASMIGATAGRGRFDDAALGNPGISSAVQAVVSWFAPVDFSTIDSHAEQAGCDQTAQQHHAADSPESRWLGGALAAVPEKVAEASIVRHVAEATSLPPYLLIHGTQDCTVPPGQSQQLHDALRARRAQVTLVMVPDAGHEDPKIVEGEIGRTLDFLRAALHA